MGLLFPEQGKEHKCTFLIGICFLLLPPRIARIARIATEEAADGQQAQMACGPGHNLRHYA